MAKHQILCHCRGNERCELCRGAKFYEYEPGPRGWMPFICPTCKGKGVLDNAEVCFTCRRGGSIDPANPPRAENARGFFRTAWQIFFGG